MIDYLKKLGHALRRAFTYTFFDHDGVEHAGFLAFLSMLSFFPFLIFLVGFAGMMGQMEAGQMFIREMQQFLPSHVSTALAPRIDEILSGPPQGLLTFAIIGIIWTASSIVEGMRTVVNRAYRVTTPPVYILRRLLSIGQFFILIMMLMMAMIAQVVVPLGVEALERELRLAGTLTPVWNAVRYLVSAVMVFVGIAGSYYYLANKQQSLSRVVPGALVVLTLWMLVAELFTMYLRNYKQFNVVYGSLEGIMATLLFFFLMALIYIFGAEFNYFYRHPRHHE